MATYIGISALGWQVMLQHWWNKLLAAILFVTLGLGIAFLCFTAYRKHSKYQQRNLKRNRLLIPIPVAQYLQANNNTIPRSYRQRTTDKASKTFGVYLGSFQNPPTDHQKHVLSSWDILVVDPARHGVLNALSQACSSTHILGRLDVETVAQSQGSENSDEVIESLQKIFRAFTAHFVCPDRSPVPFTGVLLANWRTHFTPAVCNALVRLIDDAGLDVYLELSAPEFLSADECRQIDLETTKGLVCRNGTVLRNGDRRNYFQMAEMRRALRALAAQSQMSKGDVLMWDTVDDNVSLDHGVVKRSYNWCRYYSALSWIGPEAALTDANTAFKKSVVGEPLGALTYIKDDQIVKLQEAWRLNSKLSQQICVDDSVYESLESFIPGLATKLLPQKEIALDGNTIMPTTVDQVEWPIQGYQAKMNPFAISPRGDTYTGLGCFQIGLDCSYQDFEDLVTAQRKLKDLELLQPVKQEVLSRIAKQLRAVCATDGPFANVADTRRAIDDLIQLLTSNKDEEERGLRIYMGLHSGFRTSLENRFWGLYDFAGYTGGMDMYVSLKATDLAGTIMHTFLSSRQYTRTQCLVAEVALAKVTGSLSSTWDLPQRFVQDIEGLTPTEAILFLQRATPANCSDSQSLAAKVRACCEYQLLDVPSLAQSRQIISTGYLSGEVPVKEVIESRMKWYRAQGCAHPHVSAAVTLFEEIDARLPVVLFGQQSGILDQIQRVLEHILQKDFVDTRADVFCLALFCALRKLAMTEIYLEILDRNPLPSPQPDQAACFSEMFALGSRCEAYFDMTPNAFGRILARRYDAYFHVHQPPMRDDKTKELPTAYASKQVDLNLEATDAKLPVYYQITFLGIFAFPALIDIMLLTTIGRGLYLSSYMTEDEKTMATTALMIALFLTGAIGTWIGSGGSYYLHSMAFPAMNMFVLTRWIAGEALCLVGGLVGFIIISAVKGPYPALIFSLYLVILTTYLSTLATMAVYQLPGFIFQSGRLTVMACIPILFISPIATLWVGHDIIVYLCVLPVFLAALLSGAYKVVCNWTTWYLNILFVSDNEVTKWYIENRMSSPSDLPPGVIDISTTPLPRKALLEAVQKECDRSYWSKATTDPFVLKVANAYSSTMFLMSWYCKYSRTEMPFPYSTTWNLQCKAAIDTLKSMQKGLKFHNAFVHWRQSGDEVFCGVLYFVIALMDKWVALISGTSIVGLSAADSTVYRLPVGFALGYYLVSAIFLDAVAQPLWPRANKIDPIPVRSLAGLQDVAKRNLWARRKLFWGNLAKFFALHIGAITITTALMWTFDNDGDATIMYLGYMGAYTGLLFYQYNRIFTGALALHDLLIAAALGLIVGPTLHRTMPDFAYSSVIALAIGTWTAAILSVHTAKVGWPKLLTRKSRLDSKRSTYYAGSALGLHIVHAQTIMSDIYESVLALPDEMRFRLEPTAYPGLEVMKYLEAHEKSPLPHSVRLAFRSAEQMISKISDMWYAGEIVVDLVSARDLAAHEQKMKYVSRSTKGTLHLCILSSSNLISEYGNMDISRKCRMVAETLIQASSEAIFGLSSDHAYLTQLLVGEHSSNGDLVLPENIKHQLEGSSGDCVWFANVANEKVLRYMLLDLDCDRSWDLLPASTRHFLLQRCSEKASLISEEDMNWIRSRFGRDNSIQPQDFIERCNLGATLIGLIDAYAKALEGSRSHSHSSNPSYAKADARRSVIAPQTYVPAVAVEPQVRYQHVTRTISNPLRQFLQTIRVAMKFFVVSIVADPEFQRELDYVMSNKPRIIRWPATLILNGIWAFCRALQDLIIPAVMVGGRKHISKIYKGMRGVKTTLKKNTIVIESADGDSTCFLSTKPDMISELRQYSGLHTAEPDDTQKLEAINIYNKLLVLCRRQEYSNGSLVREYTYDYLKNGSKKDLKLPISRKCVQGSPNQELVDYDEKGHIKSGSYIDHGNLTEFTYWYRDNAKYDDELLRAEYILPHMKISVSWCVPSHRYPTKPGKAIPDVRVIQATFAEGRNFYHCRWTYDHKSHPVITTVLNGEEIDTPKMIVTDYFKVFKKPTSCSFGSEDPLFSFGSARSTLVSRLLGTNTQYHPISTSRARAHLWKSWKNSKDVDAVTARLLDEQSVRSEHTLKPYWRARDVGRLAIAEAYLDDHADTLMTRVDIDPAISSWTPFAFKTSDLYTFGQGGDTVINTRNVSTQLNDTKNGLHVLAMDTGTWPNEGGGVSACRRDMVNDLRTIKWHIVAECANDYGFPKFQIERNVQSLSVLPLWGLDYLTPCHGIFENTLDSQIQEKSHNTSDRDIKANFIPILTVLVRCARAIKLDHSHIEEGTKALLDLNKYFESSRHWSDVWMSDVVKDAWRELWLTEDMENTRPISQWLDAEHPTLTHLDNSLDMWQRYLFIFSLPVPEKIPDVFQASHHFAGASYGIICKIKRGCAFHVWDHCISWREVTVFLSSAMSFDPPFVCTSLISLSRILSVLTLHHADVVLPCADFFNPGWEVELGSIEGTICHRKTYARKIDPVVNGICDMDKFEPIEKILSDKPTAVMLSHVRFVKDIKNAILAADIIINEWGLKDYRLDIYGDMERAPAYATECQEIIAAKNLRDYVILRGLGSPSKVLQQAWLFLNSSVSEGLPLAMGEAALTGVPVVCTDVGASFRVVTDPETGEAFSAVCPPNDAYALAKAQISIMGLLGEWAKFAEDPEGVLPPELPLKPTPEQSAAIAQRMYDKADLRRRLGMRGRANVLSSFSSERYLREHEQMLWLAKHQSRSYGSQVTPRSSSIDSNGFYMSRSKNSSYVWNTK